MLKILVFGIELMEDQGKIINKTKLGLETNLRDLGLSSMDMATLTVMLEDEYDIDIFEDGIVLTIGEIVKKLENNK